MDVNITNGNSILWHRDLSSWPLVESKDEKAARVSSILLPPDTMHACQGLYRQYASKQDVGVFVRRTNRADMVAWRTADMHVG
jgi:hypothetical protein